jgi:hypothetical protein
LSCVRRAAAASFDLARRPHERVADTPTRDIDIVVDPSTENARRWIVALSRLPDGAAKELADEPDVFADDKRYAIS